jgi:hypothetical protein
MCETRMEVNFFGTQQQYLVGLPHQRHEEGAYQKYVEVGLMNMWVFKALALIWVGEKATTL